MPCGSRTRGTRTRGIHAAPGSQGKCPSRRTRAIALFSSLGEGRRKEQRRGRAPARRFQMPRLFEESRAPRPLPFPPQPIARTGGTYCRRYRRTNRQVRFRAGSRGRRPLPVRPRARCPRPQRLARARRPGSVSPGSCSLPSASCTRTTPSGATSASSVPHLADEFFATDRRRRRPRPDHCRHRGKHEDDRATDNEHEHPPLRIEARRTVVEPHRSDHERAAPDERPRSEPARLQIDRQTEHAEQQRHVAHGATGKCENPKQAPSNATAPMNPAIPTPAVKNSKTISSKPAMNKKYATHGLSSVCASCAVNPSLWKCTSCESVRRCVVLSTSTRTPSIVFPSSDATKSCNVGDCTVTVLFFNSSTPATVLDGWS